MNCEGGKKKNHMKINTDAKHIICNVYSDECKFPRWIIPIAHKKKITGFYWFSFHWCSLCVVNWSNKNNFVHHLCIYSLLLCVYCFFFVNIHWMRRKEISSYELLTSEIWAVYCVYSPPARVMPRVRVTTLN